MYRENERARVTGNGREVALPLTAYMVYDLSNGNFSAIGLFQVGGAKFYTITNLGQSYYTVTHGITGASGSYTVLSRAANSNNNPNVIMSAYFAKGRTTTLSIGNGQTVSFPRSLRSVTRGIQVSSGVLASYEASSTVVFQATETKRANEVSETATDVIERLRLRFEAQGYRPAP